MNSRRKTLCRVLSILCLAALLLPILAGVTANAAGRETGLPTKLSIGSKLPVKNLYDADGAPAQLELGKYTLVTYWASWCSDCQEEFSLLPKLIPVLKEYEGAKWYLIDRVDGKRETLETGSAFIKKKNLGLPVLYDTELTAFQSLGVAQIPTTVLLDEQGRVVMCDPYIIRSANYLRAMLDCAAKGRDAATLRYVSENLLNSDGSVKTAIGSSKTDSCAQSLLAEYAALAGNEKLLAQQSKWVTKNGSTGDLGDDLRLYAALSASSDGAQAANQLKEQISQTYFPGNTISGKVSLSDLNLKALATAAPELSEQALSIVRKGYISADFPLYYGQYDAQKNTYSKDAIDTTEALMTVYHLAQQGQVKPQTIQWLKKKVKNGTLGTRYSANGKVQERYRDETPGVYALTALIALETGEQKLFTDALCRMEEFRTFQNGSAKNGSFTSKSKNQSFEQCMALRLYAQMQ
mgnify:FL=1